jgi:predicted MFS family arabinose efflux permease
MLPQFAVGLGVSESTAGLLVAGYGVCVAVTAVPLTAALARPNRRVLLSGLLLTLALGSAVGALAPTYAVLFAARIVVAAAQGVFWTMSAALAVTVVGPQRAGRGIAVVFGGISLAQVAGVPLVTALGAATSWRITLGVLAGLAGLTAVVVLLTVPDVPGRSAVEGGSGRTSLRPVLANRALVGAVTVIGASFAAVYVTLTYFGPVVMGIAGVEVEWVAAFLLLFGVAGVGGNVLAGALVDRWPTATLGGSLAGVLVAAVLLAAGGHRLVVADGVPDLGPVARTGPLRERWRAGRRGSEPRDRGRGLRGRPIGRGRAGRRRVDDRGGARRRPRSGGGPGRGRTAPVAGAAAGVTALSQSVGRPLLARASPGSPPWSAGCGRRGG